LGPAKVVIIRCFVDNRRRKWVRKLRCLLGKRCASRRTFASWQV